MDGMYCGWFLACEAQRESVFGSTPNRWAASQGWRRLSLAIAAFRDVSGARQVERAEAAVVGDVERGRGLGLQLKRGLRFLGHVGGDALGTDRALDSGSDQVDTLERLLDDGR